MFWLILTALIIICAIYFSKVSGGGSFIFLILPVMLLPFPICLGAGVYPSLVGERVAAVSLQSELGTVRNARYEVTPGTLLGGSLDNATQSSILSEYIIDYAKAKAAFNSKLATAKAKKSMPFCMWFGDGLFISNEIIKLAPIY